MQTSLDCIPCFLRQALNTARVSTNSVDIHHEIIKQTLHLLSSLDFDLSPPENVISLYEMIAKFSGCNDPFASVKKKSNEFALALQAGIEKKIHDAADPLRASLLFSIAGNIIDYGSPHEFDMEIHIQKALSTELAINDYDVFLADLKNCKTILYLADNSGELIFDGIAIKQLARNIVVAVKDKPIINDALIEDARYCGLDKICRVISNGTNCPGTPLTSCSKEFTDIFHTADIIISKGQGNFETLSQTKVATIYFLLTIKCPVVKEHIKEISGISVQCGDMILMKGKNKNAD